MKSIAAYVDVLKLAYLMLEFRNLEVRITETLNRQRGGSHEQTGP